MDNYVASLMMHNPRRWDLEKVRSLIPAREANEVLCIRLPSKNVPDTLVCEHEKSGMYSIKSAYQFFLSMDIDRQRVESSSATDQNLLWKLNIHHRVRVFAWRTCKNILPTLQNLKARKVIDNANYQWCHTEEEDLNHALFYCPLIRDNWIQFLPIITDSSPRVDCLHLVHLVMRRKKAGELEKFFFMAWGLRYRRNQKLFENNILTPNQVIQHALTLYQEHNATKEAERKKQKYSCRWQPPPAGILKLNVDGAIFSNQCRSSIGVVLRDDKGQVTYAASKPENVLADPMEIELIAILRGIQLCIPLGIAELQIESDALLIIEELKKEGRSSTLWSNLIQEIKTLLSTLPNWSIQYRGRESNGVAHTLAKFAWHLDDIALWWDFIPECSSQAIWVDSSL